MRSWVEEMHNIFFNANLKITMSELSEATGVSPSQIRYWEKKGFINSLQEQKNQNHKYTRDTLVTVMGIKYYLNQGFTLQAAYEKQREQRGMFRSVKTFSYDRVKDIDMKDGHVEMDLGPLDDDSTKEVVALLNEKGHSKIILRDRNN